MEIDNKTATCILPEGIVALPHRSGLIEKKEIIEHPHSSSLRVLWHLFRSDLIEKERDNRTTTLILPEDIVALLPGSDLIVMERDNRTTTRILPEGIVALLHGSDLIIVK